VREPEQALGRDPGPFRKPLAVDAQRRSVHELVGVLNTASAKLADIVG